MPSRRTVQPLLSTPHLQDGRNPVDALGLTPVSSCRHFPRGVVPRGSVLAKLPVGVLGNVPPQNAAQRPHARPRTPGHVIPGGHFLQEREDLLALRVGLLLILGKTGLEEAADLRHQKCNLDLHGGECGGSELETQRFVGKGDRGCGAQSWRLLGLVRGCDIAAPGFSCVR